MAEKQKRAKRRRGPRHPGVVLLKPRADVRAGWRARFTDPDSGKVRTEALPPELTQEPAREAWAVAKSQELAQRKHALSLGATRESGASLKDALEHYFEDANISKRTRKINRVAADKLLAWAKRAGVSSADQLTRPGLLKFRAALIKERKRVPKKGGKRNEYVESDEPRSTSAVNQDLNAIRTVLGYLFELSLLAHVSHTDLRALKREDDDPDKRDPLTAIAVRHALSVALQHDAEVFAATRAEQKLLPSERGNTYRYPPIAPFVLFVLLTGMRIGEAIATDWSWINLDAPDDDGKPAGEIKIPKHITKTRQGRTVLLDVSGTLRALLIATAPNREDRVGSVFGLTRYQVAAALKRLQAGRVARPGRPSRPKADFCWQDLRVTCGCYLVNAYGIFGGASAYREAKQLGHSVDIAEKHYLGIVRGIPRDARTLEAAMGIEAEARAVLAHLAPGPRTDFTVTVKQPPLLGAPRLLLGAGAAEA